MKRIIAALIISAGLVVGALPLPASAAPYCGISWGSSPKTAPEHSGGQSLTNVRTGQHGCYDRMVIDLNGSAVGYRVEYVDNLYADGSGQLIPLSGGAKLRVIAQAPNYNIYTGAVTYPAAFGQRLPGVNVTGYQTFRDTKWAGSYEGQSTIGLGVRARLPFRVFKLDNRIVVDVAHYW